MVVGRIPGIKSAAVRNYGAEVEVKKLIIIPAYNEAENLLALIQSVSRYSDYDYIIINDGSTDGTRALCEANKLRAIHLPMNLGIGGCVQTGYRYAKYRGYDIAIQLDGDGQHDPKYLNELTAPILNGEADVVIGSRFIDREGFQSTAMRRLGIHILNHVVHFCCGYLPTDATSGFRAISQKGIALFSECYAHDFPEPEAIVCAALNGCRLREIPVEMRRRENGKSSISRLKSFTYMVKVSLSLIIYRLSMVKRSGSK